MNIQLADLRKKRTALVLSGGGVKGMAHIGVIKALQENNINPTAISGVSAGALVGALYANRVAVDDMINFFKETPLFKYNFVTINKPGIFDTEKYLYFFNQFLPENRFESLQRKLWVTATDMQKGQPVYFSSGELVPCLLASAALPPVFSPVKIKGRLYSDGGIMNNFPVEPLLREDHELLIGCYTSSFRDIPAEEIGNSFQVSQRANLLMIHANSMNKLMIPDLLFRPEGLGLIGVLDKKGIDKAFQIGYDHACRILEEKCLV
ncbi:patatin-like phospholipase family protein [Robertkochia aurantiaca]|uniref:patatin-like phospholipase family protein n=1 Tax=Robertkochia aurantiaca TaxID=2873700 RepID=UPI001CCD0C90|nr:patatin-like phospholipase family protein [Robertkochia sp. 3YJGBD-33]